MSKKRIRLRLKEILEERCMSQSELARRAGIRTEVVNNFCNNKYERIQLDHLLATMSVLSISDFNQMLEIVTIDEEIEDETDEEFMILEMLVT